LPRAPADGLLAGLFGRRKPACFLLAGGIRVVEPRCAACGRELEMPRAHGDKFGLAVPILEPKTNSLHAGDGTWLFFGAKVLVADVNPQFAALLDRASAVIGEKVLVATPRSGDEHHRLFLFCARCGAQVLSKLNRDNERFYAWDWLAELEPRGFSGRWSIGRTLRRLRRMPA
jgi:hypothetical protein